jgi:hypothetical protein
MRPKFTMEGTAPKEIALLRPGRRAGDAAPSRCCRTNTAEPNQPEESAAMSWDPVGLLLMAGLLAPVLAIGVWCIKQERAPVTESADDDPMTVAVIQARLRREREEQVRRELEQQLLADADTVVLPVMRPAADDVVAPRTGPPDRPPPSPPFGVRVFPAGPDHIRRVTEGLFQPPGL